MRSLTGEISGRMILGAVTLFGVAGCQEQAALSSKSAATSSKSAVSSEPSDKKGNTPPAENTEAESKKDEETIRDPRDPKPVKTPYAWPSPTPRLPTATPVPPSPIPEASLYIDCEDGDNEFAGNVPEAPVRSLSKIASWAYSMPASTLRIRLKRGTVCEGSILLNSDQLNGSYGNTETRVIVDAYGDVALPRPVIKGSVRRNLSWSPAGVVYSRAGIEIPSLSRNTKLVKTHLGFAFGDFIVNGKVQTLAQYPDADSTSKVPVTSRILGDGSAIKDIVVADLDSVLNYGMEPDGQALIRLTEWSWFNHEAQSYDPATNRLTLASPLNRSEVPYAPLGFGIVLQGYLAALSQPGEWYYDSSAGDLYYLPEGDAPPPASAEFSLPSQGNVTVRYRYSGPRVRFEMREIRFENSFGTAVQLSRLKEAILDRVDISKASGVGIWTDEVNSVAIQDCSIQGTGASAITVSAMSASPRSSISILRNSMKDIGMSFNTNRSIVSGNGVNILVADGDIAVGGNTINGVGSNGVNIMSNKGRLEVYKNHVENFNAMIQDSGAYYLSNKNSGIYGNFGTGAKDSFYYANVAKDASTRGGIHSSVNLHNFIAYYFDFGSSDVLVEENIAINACGLRCFMNLGGSRNVYKRNLMYGAPRNGSGDWFMTLEMDWFPGLPVYYTKEIVWDESNHCYELDGTEKEKCKWTHHTGFDPNR